MNDVSWGVVWVIFGSCIGLMIGATAVDGSWERDCRMIGAHVSGSVVYECSKKVAK